MKSYFTGLAVVSTLCCCFSFCSTDASGEDAWTVSDDPSLASFAELEEFGEDVWQEPEEMYVEPAGSCGGGCLGGWFPRSDACFSDFISPITNPVFFEDPRTLTEARFVFIHQTMDGEAAGDDFQLYALQVRAALTDSLSVIATKSGFLTSSESGPDDGWVDLAAGLKLNIAKDYCKRGVVSVGAVYELPSGMARTSQGNGDGEFNVFLTGGVAKGCNAHWITTTGFRLPVDTVEESQVWYWSNHLDHRILGNFYAVAEFNWYHWLQSGQNPNVDNFEGWDLINLGANSVGGNDMATAAVGLKYNANGQMEIGAAWETPVTDRKDVMNNRITADVILRY
jgi:hypothetical protein